MAGFPETEEEWRKKLGNLSYHVMREKGTEEPFTGKYFAYTQAGLYRCLGCGTPLFASDTKFNAGCGWPSFFQAFDPKNIKETDDFSLGIKRTEITCAVCGSHLGHVFNDGPKPTGLRYCLNSASLSFEPFDKKEQK